MGGREAGYFKGFISFLQTGALQALGRNPVYLGSESILTITETWGVRVQSEVFGNTPGRSRKEKNVFLKAQEWAQVLFTSYFQNNML